MNGPSAVVPPKNAHVVAAALKPEKEPVNAAILQIAQAVTAHHLKKKNLVNPIKLSVI